MPAAFSISARRTYADLFLRLSGDSSVRDNSLYFYDLNTKVNYKFSEKDRLYLSGYFGRDVFTFRNSRRSFNADIPWGNATATLRWNHIFSRKLFANTTVVYNDYDFSFGAAQNDFALKLSSGIHDLNVKEDMDYYLSPQHKLKFGGLYTFHSFTPNILTGHQGNTDFTPNNDSKKYAAETGLYLQDDWEVSDKIKVNAGLRYSTFTQLGPYKIYQRDANGNKTDSTSFGRGQSVKGYGGLEPRLTIRYAFDDETSFKAAITRNLQYIHLVSNSGTTLPTDLWVPSTYRVQPQISWQYAAGIFKNFKDNMYETSLEVYYKNMQNQIEYKEGYTPSLKDPEEDFVFGRGWSYGAELFVNKTKTRMFRMTDFHL